MLTNSQLQTLKADIAARTEPDFVALRATGSTGAMADWYNKPAVPNTLAWGSAVDPRAIDEATDWTKFDNITSAGKRDSYLHAFFRYPRDFTRQKVRKWIEDVWGNAAAGNEAEAILLAGTRSAMYGELVFGGTATAQHSVSALKLNWEGRITNEDIIAAQGS